MSDEDILRSLFDAALRAALPDGKFAGQLPERPAGRTIVIGAGKASARMAQAFETAWGEPCEGLIVTRYGHGTPTRFIEVVEAAHPVPDAAGFHAAERILELARSAGPDDLVICLLSGGASALLTLPAGITLEEKQSLTKALLRSGAPIDVMNRIRKSLSAIKGGRLAAAAHPAKLVTYLISDVPGNDPASVGSGPTVADRTSPEIVLGHLRRYGIPVASHVEEAIRFNAGTLRSIDDHQIHMIGTPQAALEAAAAKARELNIAPILLGDAIEGESREVAKVFAGITRSVVEHGHPAHRPCVLLSGGETTVTMRGKGRGGRNTEFLLALALALDGLPGVSAIACDTDGIDGSEDNAGAWINSSILEQARKIGLEPEDVLSINDSYSLFRSTDRLVFTGPTQTNVNDFRAILIH